MCANGLPACPAAQRAARGLGPRPPAHPQEIEECCKAAAGGASEADPFEGLSPEEIDEYIAKHGDPAAAAAQ